MKKDKFSRSSRERSKALLNPETLQGRLQRRLRRGIQTNYAGIFLMIPYLQDMCLEDKIKLLNLPEGGIPAMRTFLYLSILEMLGDSLSFKGKDLAPALAAGLPYHPSNSYLHRFWGSQRSRMWMRL